MSFSTTTDRVSYAGNGATVNFAITFPFHNDADIKCIEVDNTTRVETVKSLTTHFTLTGSGVSSVGGTLTMLAAPAAGKTLVIYRDMDATQDTDYDDNDSFPAIASEASFDKLTMLVQRLKTQMSRAVRLPEGFTATFSTFLPATLTAGKVWIVNATADGLEEGPTADEIENAQGYAEAASDSADAAATSAANAANSETNAAASAAAAAASAALVTPSVSGSRAAPNNIVAATGIVNAFTSYFTTIFVQGNGAPISVSAAARISAGTILSQQLRLIGRSDVNYVDLPDGNGLDNGGQTVRLKASSIADYVWDGTNWVLASTNGSL